MYIQLKRINVSVKWNGRRKPELLFDITKADSDPDTFDDMMERKFYYDQKSDRKMYLSNEIDVEFVTRELEFAQQQSDAAHMLEDELSYIYDDENKDDSTLIPCESDNLNVSNLNVSLNRSGVVRTSKVCASMDGNSNRSILRDSNHS